MKLPALCNRCQAVIATFIDVEWGSNDDGGLAHGARCRRNVWSRVRGSRGVTGNRNLQRSDTVSETPTTGGWSAVAD